MTEGSSPLLGKCLETRNLPSGSRRLIKPFVEQKNQPALLL